MRRIRNVQKNGDKPDLQSRTARDAYHWECSLWRDFDLRVALVGLFCFFGHTFVLLNRILTL